MIRSIGRRSMKLLPSHKEDSAIRDQFEEVGEHYKRSGRRYLQAHKCDQAVEAFNRELEESPEDGSLYRGRGLAHLELNDYDQAIADLGLALQYGVEFSDTLADVYYWRGMAYKERSWFTNSVNDAEQAANDLQRAIELNPHIAQAGAQEVRDSTRSLARRYYEKP